MKIFPRIIAVLTLLPAFSVFGQLTGDPASMPLPEYPYYDPDRAVVVSIQFNSATDVELLEVLVANTRARTAIGAPPQLLLELLNQDGQVLSSQNAQNPLWERHWDEADEAESSIEAESGEGTFYVPLSETLRKVRITDMELGQELITVDVSQPVIDYCLSNPTTPICVLFIGDFE